jgi:hypothetical protein
MERLIFTRRKDLIYLNDARLAEQEGREKRKRKEVMHNGS